MHFRANDRVIIKGHLVFNNTDDEAWEEGSFLVVSNTGKVIANVYDDGRQVDAIEDYEPLIELDYRPLPKFEVGQVWEKLDDRRQIVAINKGQICYKFKTELYLCTAKEFDEKFADLDITQDVKPNDEEK